MTDYGLKVLNSNSEIQIDSTYRNYVLEKSGSDYVTNGASERIVTVSIANNPNPPIAMVRPTGGTDEAVGAWDVSYSSPNYTAVRFFGGKIIPNAGSCNFDYKIYTLLESPSDEDYGLRIYNADTKLVYDSGFKPFKILEVGSATIGTTYTHASHTSPYYVFSPWHTHIFGRPAPTIGPLRMYRHCLTKQSTTSVRGNWVVYQQVGSTNVEVDEGSGTTFNLILCE